MGALAVGYAAFPARPPQILVHLPATLEELLRVLQMSLGTTPANDIANYICRATAPTSLTAPIMMSLHTGSPGTTGANEAAGGSYARQAAGYAAASGGACALGGTVSFTGLAAATYTHIGLWDSTGTPKFLQGAALAASQAVPSGATVNITAATNTATGTG